MAAIHLLIRIGGTTGTPAPTVKHVGWIGRRRHDPKDLERRLKEQSDSTFNRRWFAELLEAQDALIAKAAKAKSEAQRRALEEAAEAAWQAAERAEAELSTENLDSLAIAFQAAANATRATAAIRKANEAVLLARQLEFDDDEEAIELLLSY